MLNKVMLIGNVGNAPEIRVTASGLSVAMFSVATTKKWKDKDGKQQEDTQWHKVSFMGKPAEIIQKYVEKGTKLYVEGELVHRKWKDNAGVEKYATEVRGSEFKLLSGKADKLTPQEYANKGAGTAPLNTGAGATPSINDIDDDLPF